MKYELNKEIIKLEKMQKDIEKVIKNAPKGSFRCSANRGYYQYYQGKKYLNKKKLPYVTAVAQKDYCVIMKEKIDKIKESVLNLLKLYEEMEQVYHSLTPGRKILVTPLVMPIEKIIEDFESIQYKGKDFDEDDTTEYYTSKGERVRSKSEKIIADELFRYGIPYKYEMPIELDTWNKKVVFYPDFTVLNKRTGEKKIIEHLGMMDNESYFENAMQKIDIYEKNGYLLGDGLLIFHETLNTPLNTKVMQNYIEKYLL